MTIDLAQLRLRDPFVLPVEETREYLLYATPCYRGTCFGLDAFTSRDLRHWEGPTEVFQPSPTFWAQRDFWAPEVHRYQEGYYLFASFIADGLRRGTQILRADSPLGPFEPISEGPVTPRDWECLDGTLYVDEETGQPWIVFCHEWVQVGDGQICAMPLSPTLEQAAGEALVLFRASQAHWVDRRIGQRDLVTDGPCLYRANDGSLLMLWSSFGIRGYTVGVARSQSGRITGPWTQDKQPLFAEDGGHGSVFRTFDGGLMLALHQPNRPPEERALFLPLRDEGGTLVLAT